MFDTQIRLERSYKSIRGEALSFLIVGRLNVIVLIDKYFSHVFPVPYDML